MRTDATPTTTADWLGDLDLPTTTPTFKGRKTTQVRLEQRKKFVKILSSRIHYISHPRIGGLECSINLRDVCNVSPGYCALVVKHLMLLCACNPEQIFVNQWRWTVKLKNVAAMKFLSMVFADNANHPLYSLWTHWFNGTEWP
ncbi:hypothetical protein MIV031R [Invertebrate iridescent virus 3]|uniref:Uncharacterized protein 031R n=1 Tax=Invertebrate iridescent virus 3 TaxID=345201 RepID=VF115_IIV3|nr:hypothetical protein MIV031R [Invertebrate iridescent virus 3]Q197C9.1 RecName: Full=Uncharacterized protein 031R [Invertebrate iridescent virus 3]ABF82061.1 hypothetical protein MIV031R [Invertebrate iridescent virus 3]